MGTRPRRMDAHVERHASQKRLAAALSRSQTASSPSSGSSADWGILTVLAFLIRLDGNLRSKAFRGGNRRPPRAADQARCDGSGHSSVGTFALSHLE